MSDVGCRKVRSGLGDQWACGTHGTLWPCRVAGQPGVQLDLLLDASPPAGPVMARVLAERLYALEQHPPAKDDARDAYGWVRFIVDRINLLQEAGRRLAEQEMTGEAPDVAEWLRRLEETAGVVIAAAESAQRFADELAARAGGGSPHD